MSDAPLNLRAGKLLNIGQCPALAQVRLASDIAKHRKLSIVFVAADDRSVEAAIHAASFFAPALEVLHFPAWDCLPYDRISPSIRVSALRMHTLSQLLEAPAKPRIIFTTVYALMQKLPPAEMLRSACFTLKRSDSIARDALQKRLMTAGYRRASKVMEHGEYALRGSIVDLFPPGSDEALRLDFFGDDIESIKRFDVFSQRSGEALERFSILPMHEVLLSEETTAHFRTSYREHFGNSFRDDALYHHISEGQIHAGMEHFLPLFYPSLSTLFDYTPSAHFVLDHAYSSIAGEHFEAACDYYQARSAPALSHMAAHPALSPDALYIAPEKLAELIQHVPAATLSPFTLNDSETAINLPIKPLPPLKSSVAGETNPIAALKHHRAQTAESMVIACHSEGSLARLEALLKEQEVHTKRIENAEQIAGLNASEIGLCVLPISSGFRAADMCLFSEQEVLGERVIRTSKKRKASEVFMMEASAFEPGELIVHREHGIGKFDGLIDVEVSGIRHACVKLSYAEGDRLFLPVENIELISRFGSEHEHVELDRLGSIAWQKRKSALKKKLKMAADALLKTAAKRAVLEAPTMDKETTDYQKFCDQFPYTETDDQLRAIEDVVSDLHSGRVMDRLVCGDVGFGKTEVAMRAAFTMVEQGYQVAMVVPTTLLARQHYQNFCERFQGFPVRIAQLSRMVSTKDAARTRAALADGSVDIVIATHAILSQKDGFKKLGLVMIDEEQHFGVKQKEQLKTFKENIHVLTLSATPIPRTLQLALSGIRELSLITTPPLDRLAIRSVVMPFDAVMIRDAILREKHRGGRTFYVTPRIGYMNDIAEKLKEIVPEVSLTLAHGQMTPAKLDDAMNDFCDGKFDVLLSTAIIESGIDIASANTMIIDHPHLFGLSQLYQLRGRVGRGKVRAHAYFILPAARTLTGNATRRLEVMQKLDHLGAGFSVASHDMDIRGFGNVLGEEQSGHIREVGIELYQAMLEEAMQEMREKRGHDSVNAHDWSPQISIGMPVLIPEHYVEDLSLRLSLYRRAGSLEDDAQTDDFIIELTDRFGALPAEVQFLMEVMRVKQWCKKAGIAKLDAGDKAMVISFHKSALTAPDALISLIASAPTRYKLRPDQSVLISVPSVPDASRLSLCIQEAKRFADLTVHHAAA